MDDRDKVIAEALKAGRSQRAVAADLGISAVAVSYRIRRSPELMRIRRNSPHALDSLAKYEARLRQLELDARAIARNIRKALTAIGEERSSTDVDRLIDV
jgi:DNA-binding Lrp family transcriptional regulator